MSNVYGQYQVPGGAGGNFLKLKSGATDKIRIFSDEPLVYNTTYPSSDKPQTKYAWVIWNYTQQQAQIMDMSVMVYKSIENLALSEWGDPTQYAMQVKRTGEGTATRYFFTPVPKSQSLTVEEEEACKAIDLKQWKPEGLFTSEVVGGKKLPETGETPDWVPDDDQIYEPTDDDLKSVGMK